MAGGRFAIGDGGDAIAPIFWWSSVPHLFSWLFGSHTYKGCNLLGKVFQPFELLGDGSQEFLLAPSVHQAHGHLWIHSAEDGGNLLRFYSSVNRLAITGIGRSVSLSPRS